MAAIAMAWRKPPKAHVTSGYLAAKAWLRPRLRELLASGWTPQRLFHPRHRGVVGLAWCQVWTLAADVELQPGGSIRFTITDPTGRVVTQTARPPARCHT